MAALDQDRNTPARDGSVLSIPVAGAVRIFAGALVARDVNGNAKPGTTATALVGIGRAEAQADNSSGADGEISIVVRKGVFRFENDGTDTVTRAHIGQECYMVDDRSVAGNDGTGTRSVAGKVFDVDSDGVWVKFV